MKTPYTLLTASIILGLGLSACSPSSTSPSEQEASQSASASAAAEEQNLSDQQKAANSAIKYTEGVADKDTGKVCESSSPAMIKLMTTATGAGNCDEAVKQLLENQGEGIVMSETMDRDTIASQASKISDTVYSFPSELFTEAAGENVFIESVDGAWKVTVDPASADAVKQIESSVAPAKG